MFENLRQLAILTKTVDRGSFRGAAKELNLSPSVVSHHISQLEDHLGVAFLYRSTRKLSLTPEGERLVCATHPLLDEMQQVFSDIGSAAGAPTGQLRLNIPAVLTQTKLTEVLSAFSFKYPGIKLKIDFTDIQKNLIEEGCDIAFRMGQKCENNSSTRSLFKVRRCLVSSARYIDAKAPVLHPNELSNWDWIKLTSFASR